MRGRETEEPGESDHRVDRAPYHFIARKERCRRPFVCRPDIGQTERCLLHFRDCGSPFFNLVDEAAAFVRPLFIVSLTRWQTGCGKVGEGGVEAVGRVEATEVHRRCSRASSHPPQHWKKRAATPIHIHTHMHTPICRGRNAAPKLNSRDLYNGAKHLFINDKREREGMATTE